MAYRSIFLDLNKQFKQNTCYIQFIESFYLKYRMYKPREVKNQIKKLVLAHSFLYRIFTSLGLHISYRTINNLYVIKFNIRNKFNFWSVHEIMNTSVLIAL